MSEISLSIYDMTVVLFKRLTSSVCIYLIFKFDPGHSQGWQLEPTSSVGTGLYATSSSSTGTTDTGKLLVLNYLANIKLLIDYY